jgi:hypothetical protein
VQAIWNAPETSAASVPVGAGSEGVPPVFGLSAAGNFDFLGNKKKK